MNERERKVIAFLLGIIIQLSDGRNIDGNDYQQLNNLADEFGTYDLDEKEFRY